MRAVDTNVLVRLIARDDASQAAAAELVIEKGVWVSVLALAETVWVLRTAFQRSPTELIAIIELLLDNKNVTVQDSDAVALALKLFRSRPTLGFSDCLLVELARKAGHVPLATFDRDLGTVEGTQRLRS